MTSMTSGDAYHRAYTHTTQQVLLDAHQNWQLRCLLAATVTRLLPTVRMDKFTLTA